MPLIKYSQKVDITFSMTPFEFIMHVVWTHLVIFTIAKNGQRVAHGVFITSHVDNVLKV
jgi:hypothetical protein